MGHDRGMIPWEIAQCPKGHNIPKYNDTEAEDLSRVKVYCTMSLAIMRPFNNLNSKCFTESRTTQEALILSIQVSCDYLSLLFNT